MSDISLAWSMSSSGIEGGFVEDVIRVLEGVIVVVEEISYQNPINSNLFHTNTRKPSLPWPSIMWDH